MNETLRLISSTVLLNDDAAKVSAEWTPPSSIEWAPAGRSTISATKGNKPWTGIVITGPEDALRLDRQLQLLMAEASAGKRSRPFVDFDHKGGQAAAIPVKFTWDNGIRLLLEWTSAGLDAIRGRTYSYFSPELILGDDDHPEALPAPGPIGALVNTPAFQRIQRLAAANTQTEGNHMSALLKAAVAKGFVPTGVGDDEAAAEHFAKKVEASAKAETENATLKAELGVLQRKQEEAEEQRKTDALAEVDGWIKAGAVTPDARDMVVGNLLASPEVTRKQYLKAGAKNAVRGEKPVKAALGHGDVSEEEDRIRNEDNPDKRRIMRAEWYSREQTRHIKAANTIDPTLIVPIAQEAAITKLGVALAPLNAFCRTFTAVPMSPKVPQIITLASASAASVLRNPTDFNQSFTTFAPITVTPAQLSMPWNLTNANIQDGLSMTTAAEANIDAIAQAIMLDVIAVIDGTNFPAAPVNSKISEWGTKGIKEAYTKTANARTRHLIVNPQIYAEIMSTLARSFVLTPEKGAQAWGFDGIWSHNSWARTTTPVAGLAGFACDPQAIAVVLGPPILAPGAAAAGLTTATATAPGAGVTVQFNTWFSTQSRTPQMSYDICLGVAKGDATAGVLVMPAAEVLLAADAEAEAAGDTKSHKSAK